MTTAPEKFCERNLFAAYVEGELDTDLTRDFEEHLQDCGPCRTELRDHRLFVCELDAALADGAEMPMPADFSRIIATRATSDMSGVRTRAEHRKALGICLLLALGGFALLGAHERDTVWLIAGKSVTAFFTVVSFVATAIYDTVAGLVVIFRVLSGKIIGESGSFGPLLVLLFLAILLLSRLLSHYRRTGATE
jgi:anti-sigma factor RsiW